MPYRKYDFSLEVRSSSLEGQGVLGCLAEVDTEGETILSEIARTAVCTLDQAPPHIPPEEQRVQAFIEEALGMLWPSVVAERLAVSAEALVRMDDATLEWGLPKRFTQSRRTKAGRFLAGDDDSTARRTE